MKAWTLILCEGAHDRAILSTIAELGCGWKREKRAPSNLPDRIRDRYPVARKNPYGKWIYEYEPQYLRKDDGIVEIRPLGGDTEVLGKTAETLLDVAKPDSFGVVVDANGRKIGTRTESFQRRFKRLYPDAAKVGAGVVFSGTTNVGLWVAPDNKSKGRLTDLVMHAVRENAPKQLKAAEEYVSVLLGLTKSARIKDRTKAILGALGQGSAPGASLASHLERENCYMNSGSFSHPTLRSLAAFVNRLTS